eukprot:5881119-Pyramimonas_sp.AAC.1
MVYQAKNNVWMCSSCGCFGVEQLRASLAQQCLGTLTSTGAAYLRRVEDGQCPKYPSKRAKGS